MPADLAQPMATAFDSVADSYDQSFTASKIGQAQRRSVWKELEKTFRAGDRVLELGCGTGVDACYLAEKGVSVVACDASSKMIDVAKRRSQAGADAGSATVSFRWMCAEEIASLRSQDLFDGAFSNFGVLNCIEDLRSLALDLAALLRPGAKALLCVMGPVCAWEIAWYLTQGEFQKAFRRWRSSGVSARLNNRAAIHVRYPRIRSLARDFFPEFRLMSVKGVGVSVPPSYVEPWVARFPRWFDLFVEADILLGRCPGIRILADHILLSLERSEA
jgi:ubiquinone/menaquinone biosynthesis C-methylase UbiE